MGRELFFNWPQAAILFLLLIPILTAQFFLIRYRKKQQAAYAPRETLSRLMIPRSFLFTLTKIGGWLLIWGLACVALMEPFGNIRYPSAQAQNPSAESQFKPYFTPHEVIFMVDTSASMGVPDGYDGETRLEEAKIIMEEIVRQLSGQTISLYAFTSELSAVVPPTLDYLFVRLSINELHLDEGDVGGTRFAPTLKSLQQDAFPQPSPKRYSVIMLTDGGDTQLETLKGDAREKENQAILTAISNPLALHLRLFTIGVGSEKPQAIPHVTDGGKPVSSKLEPDILKELAAKERGKFYAAAEWTSWDLAQELKKEIGEDPLIYSGELPPERQVTQARQEEAIVDWYYQIPLGLALLFYMINFLLPDVRRL